MSTASDLNYTAMRFLIVTRGALSLLARIRDDLANADPDVGYTSIWAEELQSIHQALYDEFNELESALPPRSGSEAAAA